MDNKKIAADGYKKLGPMSGKEKKLVVLFVLALVGWATSTITKLDPSAVAIAFVALAILTGIVSLGQGAGMQERLEHPDLVRRHRVACQWP